MMDDEKLYTSAEIQLFLRVSSSTLRRLVRRGELPARRVGRQYRFLGSEVMRALAPKVEVARR